MKPSTAVATETPTRSPTRISRDRTVSTKLTEAEFALIEHLAGDRGQWISEWVRDVLLDDHGYAVTSHSSQGLTAERVLINVDTEMHSNLINARFAYVSISRGSHAVHIFTDNAAELGERLNHDVSKTSAMSFTKEEKPKESLIQDRSLARQAEIGVQLSI